MPDVRKELAAGESLLWVGVPAQGIRLRALDAWVVPLSLGALFCDGLAEVPWFLQVPVVGLALYLSAGRLLVDAWRRRRTVYAITDQRILILEGRRLTSLHRARLYEIHREGHRHGRATFTFGARRAPAFELISDGGTVVRLLAPALPAAYR